MTQSWVNLTPLFVKSDQADQISGHFWPGIKQMTTMDPFPGHVEPGVFRVQCMSNKLDDMKTPEELSTGWFYLYYLSF